MRKARIGTLSLTLLVAGCAGERATQPPPRPVTVLPSMRAAMTPESYMQLVSSASLFAVRASQLASTQARSGALRSTAATVARDQGGIASQLSFAGRRLDLLPRAALPPELESSLERLRTSSDFDAEYRRSVGGVLAKALQAHEVFASGGSSPTLKPVARMATPITRRDLDAVRR